MTNLTEQKCEACQAGAPKVTEQELAELMKDIPDWVPTAKDGIMMLEREFSFKNWKQAQAFANKVGELAEEEFHHPELVIEWGRVKVTWWTHKINGLHKNDFICAAKTDALLDA